VTFGTMHLDVARCSTRIASEVYAFTFPTYHRGEVVLELTGVCWDVWFNQPSVGFIEAFFS
jgi:hypothetical protein